MGAQYYSSLSESTGFSVTTPKVKKLRMIHVKSSSPIERIINVQLSNQGHYKIIISDNGISVSDEQLEQIFIPFYASKTKGSGIGLSLARKVILKHNGKIDTYNNQEGGLTVELDF